MHIEKNILITGGAGFVGSSIAIYIKKKYPQYTVTCLDNLKRRGSELNLPRLAAHGIRFVHGDIRNREDLYIFEAGVKTSEAGVKTSEAGVKTSEAGVTTIIEASAEPSVLAGIGSAPDYLVNTNLMGTINCLYLAAKVKADLIFISTSRVYPIAKIEDIQFSENDTRFLISDHQEIKGVSEKGIAEDFPIEGSRSLYGATKLCSEFLVQEFHTFYNIRTVINRCGVITGPWQMGKADQGVIVLWVARHFWKQDLAYFGYGGKGKQVRDILHVDDLCRLIDYQLEHPEEMNGKLFNVGGGVEISVSLRELTAICEKVTGNIVNIREVKEDRAADIRLYLTDNTAITAATDWKPLISVTQMVTDIYHWIKDNEALLKPILAG